MLVKRSDIWHFGVRPFLSRKPTQPETDWTALGAEKHSKATALTEECSLVITGRVPNNFILFVH